MYRDKDKSFKKNMMSVPPVRSVCEVLREIYWSTDDPKIRDKCVTASKMAKAMARKLLSYKFHVSSEMGYEELSEEDRTIISEERWAQYKEELAKGIDHPMTGDGEDHMKESNSE